MNFDTRNTKIMIAENDRTVLEMLQIRLEVAGYHTLAARTGSQVIGMLEATRPHLLVLDLHLPEVDGFGVLQMLTRRYGKAPFPVLIMGRQLGADDVRKAVALGARDCLAKPFGGAEIVDRVARLLRRHTPQHLPPAIAARQTVMVDGRI